MTPNKQINTKLAGTNKAWSSWTKQPDIGTVKPYFLNPTMYYIYENLANPEANPRALF